MRTYTGHFRVHFNRKEEFPLLASFTNEDHSWEVLAKVVHVAPGVELFSDSNLDARPGLDPIWWLEGDATVTVDDQGNATISPNA